MITKRQYIYRNARFNVIIHTFVLLTTDEIFNVYLIKIKYFKIMLSANSLQIDLCFTEAKKWMCLNKVNLITLEGNYNILTE